MNCDELVNYLSDYIENSLDETLNAEAREHLANCTNCHILLDTTEKTITLCHNCAKQTIHPLRRGKILSQLQDALEHRQILA